MLVFYPLAAYSSIEKMQKEKEEMQQHPESNWDLRTRVT
jgi:hypothetical protein